MFCLIGAQAVVSQHQPLSQKGAAPQHCLSSSKDRRYCSDMRGIGTAVRREAPDWKDIKLLTLSEGPQIANGHRGTNGAEWHGH